MNRRSPQTPLKTPALVVIVLLVLGIPAGLAMTTTRSGANFADSEQFVGNRLGAGSVDIAVDGDASTLTDPEAAARQRSATDPQLFSAVNVAPGDDITGSLTINNTGTLPLHYWVTAAASSSSAVLDDWLLFAGWRAASCGTIPADDQLDAANVVLSPEFVPLIGRQPQVGQPTQTGGVEPLLLNPGESINVCLGARLPLAAPNEVQSSVVDVELIVHAQQALEVEQ